MFWLIWQGNAWDGKTDYQNFYPKPTAYYIRKSWKSEPVIYAVKLQK